MYWKDTAEDDGDSTRQRQKRNTRHRSSHSSGWIRDDGELKPSRFLTPARKRLRVPAVIFSLIAKWKSPLHPLFIGVCSFSYPKNWGTSKNFTRQKLGKFIAFLRERLIRMTIINHIFRIEFSFLLKQPTFNPFKSSWFSWFLTLNYFSCINRVAWKISNQRR